MMEAELHDGRILEFPDGTDPAVIQETVKKVLSQSPQTGVRETTEETEIQETQTPSSVTHNTLNNTLNNNLNNNLNKNKFKHL